MKSLKGGFCMWAIFCDVFAPMNEENDCEEETNKNNN